LWRRYKEAAKNEAISVVLLVLEVEPYYTYENGKHIWKLPNGKLHRLDGPASYGKGSDEYFINGKKYTVVEFWEKLKFTRHSEKIMAHILGNRNINNKD